MKSVIGLLVAVALAAVVVWPISAVAQNGEFKHGYSVFGELKYEADFKHYSYANPDAPKGGDFKTSVVGAFDSLNGFVIKGTGAGGLDFLYDSLMAYAHDENGAGYGLVAEGVRTAPDFSWIEYKIRKEARWHDGQPITTKRG